MELALFLLIIFSTNLIQGITGFAGTVLAMPFAIMIYGIDVAKPSLTILALLAGLLIAVTSAGSNPLPLCISKHSIPIPP